MRKPPTFWFRLPFTNDHLRKIGTFGAVFVAGNCLVMYYLVMKRFKESPYFVNASSILLSNNAVVKYLGEPIQFGNPDLSSKKNFSTERDAQFEVPLRGSNTKGTMKFKAIRRPPENDPKASAPWEVTNLEVFVDDRPKEKIVLIKEK